ncbi:MAG: hypothetical protein KAJ19_27785 [Gammaproteobacteria bacterium]|nr:hypothetical protein [Gammaproteobacteria bacterium]
MVNAKYAWDEYRLYWSKSEAAFGVPTDTTTNLAADVYYQFPMQHQNRIVVRRVRKRYHKHISGITDEGSTGHEGYEPLEITLTGPMLNFEMLHFCCKHADYDDANDPVFEHDTITSDARLNTTSFPIIARQENSGADVLKLFTGCMVKNWWFDWEQGGLVMLSINIELGREWTAVELDAWPDKDTQPFGPSEISKTFKKATVAYDGYISRIHFEWNDRAKLDIYDIHPVDFSYGPRSVFIDFDFVSKYNTDIADSQDKTNFDLHNRDIDITISLVKTATSDEVLIEMHKLCWILHPTGDFSHNEMYEKRTYRMGMDTDETGYLTSITIHDANDATRYA